MDVLEVFHSAEARAQSYRLCNSNAKPLEGEQTFQIRARAERAPFTGHYPDPERRLIVQPLPNPVKLGVSRGVDAIEVFRPREGDEQDVWCWKGDSTERCGRG